MAFSVIYGNYGNERVKYRKNIKDYYMKSPFQQRTVISTIVFLLMPLIFVIMGIPLDIEFVRYFGVTGAFSLLIISYAYYLAVGKRFEPGKVYGGNAKDLEEYFSTVVFTVLWAPTYFFVYAISYFPAHAFRAELFGLNAFIYLPAFFNDLIFEKGMFILVGFLISIVIREVIKETQTFYTKMELYGRIKELAVIATAIGVSAIIVLLDMTIYFLFGGWVIILLLIEVAIAYAFELEMFS